MKADGFIKGFSSITADSNADQALLYTGQGRDDAPRLVDLRQHVDRRRRLRLRRPPRLHELPAGRGRQGRPERHRRQPRRSTCRSRRRPPTQQKETAKKFFATGGALRRRGPGVDRHRRRADRQRRRQPSSPASKDADFLELRLRASASKAKSFAQSWDQALSPTAAEKLLDNIAQLFQLSITPAAVRRQHERGHRQVTALAPPGAGGRPAPRSGAPGGARLRRAGWRCRRWSSSSRSAWSRCWASWG